MVAAATNWARGKAFEHGAQQRHVFEVDGAEFGDAGAAAHGGLDEALPRQDLEGLAQRRRLTPRRAASLVSIMRSPGFNVPSTMALTSFWTTCSVSAT